MRRAVLIAAVFAFLSSGCSCQREASLAAAGPPAAQHAPARPPAPEPAPASSTSSAPEAAESPAVVHTGGAGGLNPAGASAAPAAGAVESVSAESADSAAPGGAPGREWGIEVLGVQLSAAGHMLDLRFRVFDPEKAQPLLARDLRPWLVDQSSGLRSNVPTAPRVGQLRQHTESPDTERTYFAIFQNPGRRVRPGSLVTVGLGECVLENLRVTR